MLHFLLFSEKKKVKDKSFQLTFIITSSFLKFNDHIDFVIVLISDKLYAYKTVKDSDFAEWNV